MTTRRGTSVSTRLIDTEHEIMSRAGEVHYKPARHFEGVYGTCKNTMPVNVKIIDVIILDHPSPRRLSESQIILAHPVQATN